MQRFLFTVLAAAIGLTGTGTLAWAMPIKPINVALVDIPNGNQLRGNVSFMGLPKGVAVQVSLRVASHGPDAAYIATGTCTKYKKQYTLKPAINGLSNTVLPTADMVSLFKTPHVVVLPQQLYCGVLKMSTSH